MQDKKYAKKKKKREKFVVVAKMKTSSARVPEICEEEEKLFQESYSGIDQLCFYDAAIAAVE